MNKSVAIGVVSCMLALGIFGCGSSKESEFRRRIRQPMDLSVEDVTVCDLVSTVLGGPGALTIRVPSPAPPAGLRGPWQ